MPLDFSPSRVVVVLAGKGRYPELTVGRLRAARIPVKLVAFVDETSPELVSTFAPEDTVWIKVGQLGHMLDALKRLGAGYSIMAGQITPRRLFRGLTPDVKAVMILASLKEKNAETIFGALAQEISKTGVTHLDARAFLDDQLATRGCMTGWRSGIDSETLDYGVRIAKEIARLNIGQGVVVSGGTTVAVEAFEGTDKMLRRCSDVGANDPLFVKTVKPGQDYRFDVPCFGLTTLESMAEGGVRHAALEAGNVLMLDKDKVINRAKELGITLHGY
ncbi:MAG: UDP-2,3-diacylglucosamine diphosphatase LpxI [Puniceicoccales bacterium]|nr:UDP-2,3-diacylglucosamine diphosphatase LpxI [Puniceicoccales bacterium]